uniref:RING-type domain-containing protein n=1 Tax=viral metagenome TaxID=1070528 RepID=A0A6C0CND0_9ZZZZ
MNIRQQRALSQRIYLLDSYPDQTYLVAGLTNNYRVSLHPVSCTCMDFIRRQKTCKHLYFIQHRVGQPKVDEIKRDDKECAICYEDLTESEHKWKCSKCFHEIHLDCFQKWRTYNRNATCPYCRQ